MTLQEGEADVMAVRAGSGDPKKLVARAACDLVAEGGLENATLRRVAARLGTTTGYISHYFAGKDDLLEAALTTALDEVSEQVGRAPKAATFDEWLVVIENTLPNDAESKRFWRVLVAFQAVSLTSARLQDVLRNYSVHGERMLAARLREELPADVPEVAVQDLARAIWVLIDGIATTAITNPGALTVQQQSLALRGAIGALIEDTKHGRTI